MINTSTLPTEIQENPEITIGELAVKHGSSYHAMASALKRTGIRAKRKKTTKRRMSNGEMNFTAVAEQFNCTREYVSQIEAIAREEGIIK
jgi:hypothetical protein